MKNLLFLLCSSVLFSACSRTVVVRFEKQPPTVVPSKNFSYKHDIVSVKSANQNVMYSANELSSRINILINVIDREFKKANIQTVKEAEKADMLIEVIGIEPYEYHTNKAKKLNGKPKLIPCRYHKMGYDVYVRMTDAKGSNMDYTFKYVPCIDGCVLDDYGYYCDGKAKKKKNDEDTEGYEVRTSADDFPTGVVGAQIAASILRQLNN